MTYKAFEKIVAQNNWTPAQLRCDVPPSEELLEFIASVGKSYEKYVIRYTTVMECIQ